MADRAAAAFDAVLVVSRASDALVAGMRLTERAAFTVARAGARRLLCVGERPTATLRFPSLAIEWTADVEAPIVASWIATTSPFVVVIDAATVFDPDTVTALLAAPGTDTLSASGRLLRTSRSQLLSVLRSVAASSSVVAFAVAGARSWIAPPGALLHPAHDAESRTIVTHVLFSRLGRPGDGWLTRLVDRRISRALTRLLLPTGVTPNAITLASVAIGIVAGGLFAGGESRAGIAGALLFLTSTIIDGCDGELARLTFRESRLGARLDVIGDNVVHVAVFGGIALGLFRHGHDRSVALAGAALVVGVLASMATVYANFVRREPSARQRALFEAFASREFAYLLVVLTLAGRLEWFLWLSTLGTYAFVIGLVALRR